MFCSQCGVELEDESRFCSYCGSPVDIPVSVTEQNINTEDRYQSMSVDELVRLANNGDSEAMIRVASVCMGLDENTDINGKKPMLVAIEWLKQAALAGHAGGIPLICSRLDVIATMNETIKGLIDPEVVEEKCELYKWYLIGFKLYDNKAPGWERIKIDEHLKDLDNARYRFACALYLQNSERKSYSRESMSEALSLLSGHNNMRSRILKALIDFMIIIDMMCNSIEIDDASYKDTVRRLSLILDEEYASKGKPYCEEAIMAISAVMLSSYYSDYDSEIKTGFDILNFVRSTLQDDRSIGIVDDELALYKRNSYGELFYDG